MKKIFYTLIVSSILFGCSNEKALNIDFISNSFNERISEVDRIQYQVQNIMTFIDGTVWDHSGQALLEKEPSDSIFGFSFYGYRNDAKRATIYKAESAFQTFDESQSFRQEEASIHILGSPGGQMIYKDFFKLEEDYQNVEIKESENVYTIIYAFTDDIEKGHLNSIKRIELDKDSFLPQKVLISFKTETGAVQSTEYIFENFRINEDVDSHVSDFIADLNKYEQIKEEVVKPSPLLGKQLPKLTLKNLLNSKEEKSLNTNKLVLLDFWEVWCGPCIQSMPKVEEIHRQFKDDLEVYGIVSQDSSKAKQLIQNKNITFQNLIGNRELKQSFNVNSIPRYFLIDENGIIKKEYFGFSEDIENDIRLLLTK